MASEIVVLDHSADEEQNHMKPIVEKPVKQSQFRSNELIGGLYISDL